MRMQLLYLARTRCPSDGLAALVGNAAVGVTLPRVELNSDQPATACGRTLRHAT